MIGKALAQTAQAALANGSPDQSRCKARENIAPLLHIPAIGELFVSEMTQPFHAMYVPLMDVDMYGGGSPVALSTHRKPGSRPEA